MFNLPIPHTGILGQRLTVDGTVRQLGTPPLTAGLYYVDFQNADVMVTLDGSDPSATNGHRFAPGANAVWANRTVVAAKFIRQGTVDGVVSIAPMR